MALQFEKPSPRLLREYDAVAQQAAEVARHFERPNFSTANLPLEALKSLLAALCLLPKGTAEGGRILLIEALDQLGDIRSGYIHLDDKPLIDEHGAPQLQRHDTLDKEIGTLIGAVATALAAANREAGIAMADPEPAHHVANDPPADEVTDAITEGKKTSQAIHSTRKTLGDILNPDSKRGDTLQRRLADSEALTKTGISTLEVPSVVSRWSRRISNALARTPAGIRRAANAIDTAHDIGRMFWNQWRELQDKIETLISDNIPKFTANLRKAADRLEYGPGGKPPPIDAPAPPPRQR